ncbi:MAG: hypothetical protein KBS94_02300 [Prevotella sp.]|nr:hypothetical protein [Candidatus Equicola faecalis]
MITNRQKICILTGFLFQLEMGGLSYWFITVNCGLDNFLGLVAFVSTLILTKIILITVRCLLGNRTTPIIYNNVEHEDARLAGQDLSEDASLNTKREKEDEAANTLHEIVAYTSLTLNAFFCSEDMELIKDSVLSFKASASDITPIERPLSAMNGLTTKDLYHFGWNVGRRLEKSRDEIAWFLRHLFPLVFANTDHSTIVKKMTNNDGAFRIRCVPLGESLLDIA